MTIGSRVIDILALICDINCLYHMTIHLALLKYYPYLHQQFKLMLTYFLSDIVKDELIACIKITKIIFNGAILKNLDWMSDG